MSDEIRNLRIQFYGVQGSGSTFPSSHETSELREALEYELLKRVFEDLSEHAGEDNRLDCSLDILGGPIDKKSLLRYRKRFDIPMSRIYGGWTTCCRVETSDGYDIVFDCGSGFRNCAKDLQSKWGSVDERHLYIFGSHSHLDHTEGFDQAIICFDPRNHLHIHGNYQFLYALDSYLGIFSRHVSDHVLGVQTPINYSIMPAGFSAIEIRDLSVAPPVERAEGMERAVRDVEKPIDIGNTRITAIRVCHPSPCYAYKLEHGGKVFVFCTDHERRHGPDPDDKGQKSSEDAEARIWEHVRGADVVYRDGQFLRSEYDGISGIGSTGAVARIDWGHSCFEDVQKMALECGVRQTYLGHHDPNREWSELNWLDESLARSCEDRDEKIELARAGTVIDL